jgi:hypothetical protein
MNNKKGNKKRATKIRILIMVLVTVLAISIVAFAGPTKAFVINLVSDKSTLTKGDSLKFNATVTINSNENLPIEKLILELSGPENVSCEFAPDGTIITGCKGITITRLYGTDAVSGYGYGNYNGYGYSFGYGYGYDKTLNYEITLITDNYLPGEYTTKLLIPLDSNTFSGSSDSSDPSEITPMLLALSDDTKTFSQNGPIIEIKSSPINPVDPENNTDDDIREGSSTSTIQMCSWDCSQWTSCLNGRQTRDCIRVQQNCYTTKGPEQERVCTNKPIQNLDSNDGTIDLTKSSETQTNINSSSFSGITGASIANITNNPVITFVILLILIIIVLFLILITLIVRRANRIKRIRMIKTNK